MAEEVRELKGRFSFDVSRTTQQALDSFRKMKEFFEVAKVKAGDFEKAVDKVGNTADKAGKKLSEWQQILKNSNSLVEALADGTSRFSSKVDNSARSFQSLLRPLDAAQNTYIRAMGKFASASKDYLMTQNRIEAAQVKIGKSMTQASLPAMETMARIAEKVAGFIEKHPGLANAAVTVTAVAAVTATANATLRESSQAVSSMIDATKLMAGMGGTLTTKIKSAFGGLKAAGAELLASRTPSAASGESASIAKRLAELAAGGATTTAPMVAGATVAGGAMATGGTAAGGAMATGGAAGGGAVAAGGTAAGGAMATGGAAAGGAMTAGAAGAAAKMVAIPAILTAGVLAASAGLGVLIGEAILGTIDKITGKETREQANNAATQGLSILAYGAGKLSDSIGLTENAANDWFIATAGATHATDAQTQALLENANAIERATEVSLTDNKDFGQAAGEYRQYLIDIEESEESHRNDELRAAERLAQQIADTEEQYNKDRLKSEVDFAKQSLKEEVAHFIQQNKEVLQFRKQEAKEDKERARQKAKEAKSFAAQEAKAEADYNEGRLKTAEKWGEEALKREADFQRQQARAAEDHGDRMIDLAGQRDALGIVREMRAYEKDRRRAEEDHNREVSETNAQHAQDLKDQAEAFAEQRAERIKEFAERNKEEEEEFAYRRAQSRAEFDERRQEAQTDWLRQRNERQKEFALQQAERRQQQDERIAQMRKDAARSAAEADRAYEEQSKRREKQLVRQLAQLDSYAFLMEKVTKVTYEGAAKEFTLFVTGLKSQIRGGQGYTSNYATVSQQPGFTGSWTSTAAQGPDLTGSQIHHQAEGGYAGFGLYMRGERGEEFVLNALATRAAEQVIGARLSQEKLIGALSGGGRGNLTVTVTNQFSGGAISHTDRRALVDQSVEASLSAIEGVIRQLSSQLA